MDSTPSPDKQGRGGTRPYRPIGAPFEAKTAENAEEWHFLPLFPRVPTLGTRVPKSYTPVATAPTRVPALPTPVAHGRTRRPHADFRAE